MSALAESTAAAIEAKHRADELYKSLRLSVAMLKKLGVDVSKFEKTLKEYKQ